MSSGRSKSKKKSSKSSSPIVPILFAMISGAVVIGLIAFGAKWVMGQRNATKEYEASIAKISEQLKRDPDQPAGALKVSEIPGLISGTPTVTRETKDGGDYAIYRWNSAQEMGIQLKIEKNGPFEEVTEMKTLGAQ